MLIDLWCRLLWSDSMLLLLLVMMMMVMVHSMVWIVSDECHQGRSICPTTTSMRSAVESSVLCGIGRILELRYDHMAE